MVTRSGVVAVLRSSALEAGKQDGGEQEVGEVVGLHLDVIPIHSCPILVSHDTSVVTNDVDTINELILILDGSLAYLPFDVLLTKPANSAQNFSYDFSVVKFSLVSYLEKAELRQHAA